MKAKIVRVTVDRGREGLYYAESPDLKGLLVAEPTLAGLRKEIPLVIQRMYAACDVQVIVSEIEGEDENSWVAVPTQHENGTAIGLS
jgi:hypothetical protein